MSTISLGGSGIIGISYGETSLLKSNLLRAKERRDSAASNVNSAKMKLQVNGSSGRIRVEADNLQSYYSSIKNNNAKIDKVIRDIDYIVRRFKEVDSRCANRIKSIGRGYKVRSGISKIGNSLISFGNKVFNGISSFFNDGMNAIKSMGSSVKNWFSSKYTAVTGWLDSHPIVGNTASFALNALAVVGAGATLFFGGPVIAVVGAVIGGALALNGLIDDGTKIYNNVTNGSNKGFNALDSGLKAVAGEKAGGMVYAGLNLVDFALNIPHMVKGLKNIKNIKPSLINAGKAIKSFPSKVTGMAKSFGTKGTEFIKDTGKVFKMSFNNYISDTRSVTAGANLGGEFNKLGSSFKKAIADLGDIKAQSEIRRVVLNNIEQSKIARKVSNYQEFAKKEAKIYDEISKKKLLEGVTQADVLKMSGLDKSKIHEIVSIPKGSRPDPSTYLNSDYMEQHLKKFENGGSFVMTKKQYMRFVEGKPYIGCPDNTQFIAPKDFMDEIGTIANGDISIYEKKLGFDEGHFAADGGLVRFDIKDPQDLNVRIPSGNEFGANEHWLPGGYTDGGTAEAIIDNIPNNTDSVDIEVLK